MKKSIATLLLVVASFSSAAFADRCTLWIPAYDIGPDKKLHAEDLQTLRDRGYAIVNEVVATDITQLPEPLSLATNFSCTTYLGIYTTCEFEVYVVQQMNDGYIAPRSPVVRGATLARAISELPNCH